MTEQICVNVEGSKEVLLKTYDEAQKSHLWNKQQNSLEANNELIFKMISSVSFFYYWLISIYL